MTTCTFCKGARWLGGVQALGRCVCVTPEAMLALEDTATEFEVSLLEAMRLQPGDDILAQVENYVENVDAVHSGLTAGAKKHGPPDNLAQMIDAALDDIYDEAPEVLSDYLVSIGLPARPAGAVDNPALQRLIDLIF